MYILIKVQDKSFKEKLNNTLTAIKDNSEFIIKHRRSALISLSDQENIKKFENEMLNNSELPLIQMKRQLEQKKAAVIEMKLAQKSDKFIEI